jgi:hypothetical protein
MFADRARMFAVAPSINAMRSGTFGVRARAPLASRAAYDNLDDAIACCELPSLAPRRSVRDREITPYPSEPGPARSHVALARLQRADGSWELDRRLCVVLGVERGEIDAIVKVLGRDREAKTVVATLAALRFLETRGADAREEWRLLAEKAEQWLAKALASRPAHIREELEQRLAALLV